MIEIIFVSKTFSPIHSLVPAQSSVQWEPVLSSGVKRPVLEVYHTHPFSKNIKSEWSYTSTALMCLYDEDRDKFTHYFCVKYFSKMQG